MTLLSALLAATVSPWFLLLTAFVGINQWLYVRFGNCPASLVLGRFGVVANMSLVTADPRAMARAALPGRSHVVPIERTGKALGPWVPKTTSVSLAGGGNRSDDEMA